MQKENINFDEVEVISEKQIKLQEALTKLKLIARVLDSTGFTVEKNIINTKCIEDWGYDGFPITEDSKIKIKILYNNKDGIRVAIEEKTKKKFN